MLGKKRPVIKKRPVSKRSRSQLESAQRERLAEARKRIKADTPENRERRERLEMMKKIDSTSRKYHKDMERALSIGRKKRTRQKLEK